MNQLSPVESIHALGRFSGKPGLHRIRALCDALGNPQDRLKFIHIAGTNGKGSTATMLASVLQHAGYRTGLYTSPYLVTFHERIRVNGIMISDSDLSRLFEQVQAAASTLTLPENEHIGEFEFVTAIAFLYFLEQGCDIVVLETGLGGSYDATNIIAPPEAAIITSISLDHTAVLGNTVEEIAQTKAGIYKPGSIHITSNGQANTVYQQLKSCAPDLIITPDAEIVSADLSGSKFIWQGKTYQISLPGLYQVSNASTVLTTLQQLKTRGWHISEQAISAGLFSAYIPGRMQVCATNPCILLDGGHNPDGIRKLSSSVKSFNITGSIYLVIGMCKDKSIRDTVKEINFPVQKCYVTPLQNERTMDANELAALMHSICGDTVICQDCAAAIAQAKAQAAPDDLILICGSLYLVGEAEEVLRADRKRQNISL